MAACTVEGRWMVAAVNMAAVLVVVLARRDQPACWFCSWRVGAKHLGASPALSHQRQNSP